MQNPKNLARQYPAGFLIKSMRDCEGHFKWMKFNFRNRGIEGEGRLSPNGRAYDFKLVYSPLLPERFERVRVNGNSVKPSFETHFNGDGTLCLYHPVWDVKKKGYLELVEIIPMLSEWVYYYDKYLEYNIWLGPEYPHGK